MFGTTFTTATRPCRNSSTPSSSRSTSETPCTYQQSEEHDAEPAAKDAAKDNEVPKGFGYSNPAHMIMIDKLRDLDVDTIVALPQLVVVGDQNSGKSSVLEAIMEFPFPRDNGLCTRFATNIVFRRSAETRISVSIRPAKDSFFNLAKLNEFKRDGIEKLDEATFRDILDKASEAMGITKRHEIRTIFNKAFSKDMLKIVISGPDRENLSIIDIPGIIRSPTPGVTTESDIRLVKDMVKHYIKDERTIILAVVPANADIATQEILSMAKRADPAGERTLAVLTKPDIVDKGGEQNIIDLVNGKLNKLTLGYCIVRNRGQYELDLGSTTAERTTKELEFFQLPPWNVLDTDRVGVKSLKSRLQRLLAEIIDREFPKIRNQIESRLEVTHALLHGLGSERESPEQQRRFLDGIAIQFQAIRNDAMDKMYHRHQILMKDTDLRLPTLVAKACDQLVDDFRAHGTTVPFDGSGEPDSEDEFSDPETTNHPAFDFGVFDQPLMQATKTPTKPTTRLSSTKTVTATYPELDNLSVYKDYDRPTDTPIAKSARSWIESEYRGARGYEVEVMDASILPLLWRTQTQTWAGISRKFLKEVIEMVHRFILGLLHKVCPDTRTRTSLTTFLLDEMIKRYNGATDSVRHILAVERSGKLITRNHYFADTLSKTRSRRTEANLNKMAKTVPLDASNPKKLQKMVDIADLTRPATTQSNLASAVDELHAVLCVYHKVARKRTVDNIIQNVDYFLLTGEQSPLNILTTGFVSGMTREQLQRCAGEDEVGRGKRKQLKNLIETLEKGRKVIRGL